MVLDLDPRLLAAVLVELALLGYVIARQARAQTGLSPGGTAPWAWGLICGLLPIIGLLLLVEAITRPDADESAESEQERLAIYATTVLPG
jgi:hypothetical protein